MLYLLFFPSFSPPLFPPPDFLTGVGYSGATVSAVKEVVLAHSPHPSAGEMLEVTKIEVRHGLALEVVLSE